MVYGCVVATRMTRTRTWRKTTERSGSSTRAWTCRAAVAAEIARAVLFWPQLAAPWPCGPGSRSPWCPSTGSTRSYPRSTQRRPGRRRSRAGTGGADDDGQGVGTVRNAEIGEVDGEFEGRRGGAATGTATAHPPVGRPRAVLLRMARGHVRADGVEVSVAKLPSTWRGRSFCNLWA